MRVPGKLLLMASLLAAAPAVAVQAPVPESVRVQMQVQGELALEKAAAAIDEGRHDVALSLVGRALAVPDMPPADLDWAAYLAARAQAGLGKASEAERLVRERHKANPNAYNWASLISILAACGRHAEAAGLILSLKEGDFIQTRRLRPALVENILLSIDASAPKLRDDLVMRLVEGRYSGPVSQQVPDTLRLRYISLLLRQGRVEDAARETRSLETPAVLSALLADKAYAVLWAHDAVRPLLQPGGLVARVERGVQARLEQPALSSSDWIELMRAMRVIGRADEAVRLGLHALEQARRERRAAGPALRLEIARAYADQGEAWAARRTARELLKEETSLPAVLRVAVAQVLEITGDDEGALLLLGTISGAERLPSALAVTACAAHDLGRAERRDDALLALEANVAASPSTRFDAYVCTGLQDKASGVIAEMLADPASRSAAILLSQLYMDPAKPGSDQKDLRYRMRALVASSPVQTALQAHARTLALPFTSANARQ